MPQAMIAVIGGTGFIGRHLLERLAADPPERIRVLVHSQAPSWLEGLTAVEIVQGDLLRTTSLEALLDGATHVINLAGQVSADVGDYQSVNLRGMVNLAQACLKLRVPRIIHASSALVYGTILDATEESPCRPISPYATMKLAAEEILSSLLAPTSEMLSLRLSNVYGPRQRNGLMPYLVKRILKSEPITIDADGAQVRDFVHVQDVVNAFLKAVDAPDCVGAINIGSGEATSIMTLLRILEDVLEIPAKGQYCPEHSGGERKNTVNVSRAQHTLGWQTSISLTEGIQTLLASKQTGTGERMYA
jgi:nucleoside-diphosphate-sugar epimerase